MEGELSASILFLNYDKMYIMKFVSSVAVSKYIHTVV